MDFLQTVFKSLAKIIEGQNELKNDLQTFEKVNPLNCGISSEGNKRSSNNNENKNKNKQINKNKNKNKQNKWDD